MGRLSISPANADDASKEENIGGDSLIQQDGNKTGKVMYFVQN